MSSLFSRSTKRPSHWNRPKATRLRLEALEDRRLLSGLSWSTPAETGLPTNLSSVTAVLAVDHSVLLFGGGSDKSVVYDQAYGSNTWTSVNPLASSGYPVTVSSPGVSSIGGGKLLVYGNLTIQTPDDPTTITALQYDPLNAADIANASSMLAPQTQFAFATDGSNDAYAIGGTAAGSSTILSNVESYNPATGKWSQLAALPQPITGAAAVYDGKGNIFVFGGATSTSSSTATASVEEYTINPGNPGTWTTVSTMPVAATQAAAVLGTDGLIYVLGGQNGTGALNTVQVYDPVQNTWSQGTALPHSLYNEAAVVDASGRINVIGQYGSDNKVQAVYVSQVLANVAPSITTTALPAAMAGNPYTAWVTVTATPPATISVQSGPPGLNIDPNTGEITWTPAEGMANTQQSVTIQATSAYGTATQTTTQTISIAVTPDTTIPTMPLYLNVGANITASSLPLSWNASTDGDGVAGYTLYAYTPPVGHSGKGGGITKPAKYTPIVTGITTTSYTVTGLSPGTFYQYAVAAYDGAGNVSPYSNVATATTYIAPKILCYLNGAPANPPFSVVANHQLYITLSDPAIPTATLSMYSDSTYSPPSGVVFSEGQYGASITWTPTADQVGTNDIIMQSTNSVGTTTLDIQVSVTADLPVPSLIVNGGYAYTTVNMTTTAGSTPTYQLPLNPGFNATGRNPQIGLVGTPFAFQVIGNSNTNPTTYALVSGPSTMTLDPNTGVGAWTPGPADVGTTSVTINMTNSVGTTQLTFTFPTEVPPTMTWSGTSGGLWSASQWSSTSSTTPVYPDATVNAAIASPVVVQVPSSPSPYALPAANALAITNGGQVAVASGGSLAVSTSASVTSGGVLSIDPNGQFSAGGTLTVDSGGSVTGGPVTAAAYQFSSGTIGANLGGPGGLAKGGSGTAVLSGVNTYAGPTQVTSDTLQVLSAASLPDGATLIVGANAATAFGTIAPAASPTAVAGTSAAKLAKAAAVAAPSAPPNSPQSSTHVTAATTAAAQDEVLRSGVPLPAPRAADVAWLWAAVAQQGNKSTVLTAAAVDQLLARSGI